MSPRSRKDKGHYGSGYRRLRSIVFSEEQLCWLCEEFVDQTLHWMNPGAPQLHLSVPLTQGGSWRDRRNCHLVHRSCNIRQGNKFEGQVQHRRPEEPAWVIGAEP